MPRRYWCFGIRVCVCARVVMVVAVIVAVSYCVGTYSLLAGITISRWYYCHTLVSLGYFMRLPNNWISLLFDLLNMRFGCFFFISRSGVPTISRSRIIYVRIDESTSSPALRRVRVCLFWQRAPILICLYFQFLYGCNRLPLIPWDLLRNIQTRHVRSHVCSKIELKKTNKRVGKL